MEAILEWEDVGCISTHKRHRPQYVRTPEGPNMHSMCYFQILTHVRIESNLSVRVSKLPTTPQRCQLMDKMLWTWPTSTVMAKQFAACILP